MEEPHLIANVECRWTMCLRRSASGGGTAMNGCTVKGVKPLAARLLLSHRIGTARDSRGSCGLMKPHRGLAVPRSVRNSESAVKPSSLSRLSSRQTSAAESRASRRQIKLLSSTYLSQGAARPKHSIPSGRAAPPLNLFSSAPHRGDPGVR